jgi:tetratricopeptide (TPR) repeat protein
LSAFDYLKDRTEAKRGRAHDCLEAEIIADPQNSAALTMLSAFLVHDYLDATPGGNGEEDLSRATRLAQRAITYDPQRARPNYTLFLTGFYDKRFDEAFLAAHRALELNPNAGIFSTQLGASYISRGEYEKGEALFRNAEKRGWTPPGILNAFFALAAYMRGDEMRIRDFARRASAADGSIGLLLKIAVCHQYHDADGAARAYELLLQKFPGVATDVPAALDRYAFSDKIKEKLLSDLHQAGYAIANQTFPVAH